jgi:hypothetical protein
MLLVTVKGPLDCAITIEALPPNAKKKSESIKLVSSDALKRMPVDLANRVFI